ncbi:MAG: GNAT family N-acetyltransferase [Balneolales bacterium]|nr:GNAT family N-acetyltransferase [Balneolales bacterium]
MTDDSEFIIMVADYSEPDHAEAVLTVLDAYSRDPMGLGQPLSDFVRENLIEELDELPTAVSLLAFIGDKPVGLANCFLGVSSFRAKRLLNIHDLAVVPEYRGRGIGKLLLEAVEAKAEQMGCCKITLEVREDNRAQKLYREFGFAPNVPEMLFWSKEL